MPLECYEQRRLSVGAAGVGISNTFSHLPFFFHHCDQNCFSKANHFTLMKYFLSLCVLGAGLKQEGKCYLPTESSSLRHRTSASWELLNIWSYFYVWIYLSLTFGSFYFLTPKMKLSWPIKLPIEVTKKSITSTAVSQGRHAFLELKSRVCFLAAWVCEGFTASICRTWVC